MSFPYESPKGVVTLKNVPEELTRLWTRESQGEIEDAIGNATETPDFIVVHMQRGAGNFVRLVVNIEDVVTVGVYS